MTCGPMGRTEPEVLSTGMRVLYWDKNPNGEAGLHEAVVIRARGLSVLLTRVFDPLRPNKPAGLFRVSRSEVNKVLSATPVKCVWCRRPPRDHVGKTMQCKHSPGGDMSWYTIRK